MNSFFCIGDSVSAAAGATPGGDAEARRLGDSVIAKNYSRRIASRSATAVLSLGSFGKMGATSH